MPFETNFVDPCFEGTISATVHEHGGEAPTTIIRTDQSWAVNVHWDVAGSCLNLIHGFWHLHVKLESLGPGADLDLIDDPPGPINDHVIPLTPPNGHYFVHFDVDAGTVPAPASGGLYKLVVSLTYRTLILPDVVGPPGPIAAYVEGPVLQFYNPGA